MCRNIRALYNSVQPATEAVIESAELQFMRKLTNFNQPNQVNAQIFFRAAKVLSQTASGLLTEPEPLDPNKNRDQEPRKRQEQTLERFGR